MFNVSFISSQEKTGIEDLLYSCPYELVHTVRSLTVPIGIIGKTRIHSLCNLRAAALRSTVRVLVALATTL
jgi:hypothetical protein